MTEKCPSYVFNSESAAGVDELLCEPSRFNDEFWAKFFHVLHRILVTGDDFLCAEFKFSRRARGKWTKRLTPDP